ncbi:MAG: hypothetical protein IK081_13770, partial [Lachnospiraceae bacterium]|nr:hypothetical protein [Lachnospiraceae bacterium]
MELNSCGGHERSAAQTLAGVSKLDANIMIAEHNAIIVFFIRIPLFQNNNLTNLTMSTYAYVHHSFLVSHLVSFTRVPSAFPART